MISFPSSVTLDPAENLSRVRTDVDWPPAEDAKLTSCLGQKQDPAPSRGTRKTSSARTGEGEGRGRLPGASGSGQPARPAHRTAAAPGRRGRGRCPGARRASAALGRHRFLSAAPRAGRQGYCLDSACRALRPRRRCRRHPEPEPEPEPRSRAGSMAAPSPCRPSGRPSFRPSLPAFPTRPRTLFSSLSRFPAAVPPLPCSFSFASGGGSPRRAGDRSRRQLRLLTSLRGRGRGRDCVPRRRATVTRARDREGREDGGSGEKGGGMGQGRRRVTASQAAAATAPPPRPRRVKRLRAASPRRGRGRGRGGLPPASPQPPTAGQEAGAGQSARGGGAGRRRRLGAVGRGPGEGQPVAVGSRARRAVRPTLAQAPRGLPAAPCPLFPARSPTPHSPTPEPPKVGNAGNADPACLLAAQRPAREIESPQASAAPADGVSLSQETTAAARCSFPRPPFELVPQRRSSASSKSQPHTGGETKLALGMGKGPAKWPQDRAFVRGNMEKTALFYPEKKRNAERTIRHPHSLLHLTVYSDDN
nr:translation initiation factor IF-2-like [Pongo pygmaeus]